MNRLWRWLGHEVGLKALSLAIALVLVAWRSNEANPVQDRSFTGLAVEPTSLDQKLQLVGKLAPVNVSVRGRRRELDQMVAQHLLRATVDCKQVDQPTLRQLEVSVQAPSEVQVVKVDPPQCLVEIDAFAQEKRPVRADFGDSAPPGGYSSGAAQLTLSEAQVRGPRRQVSRVVYFAAEIDLTGGTRDVTGEARLEPMDADGQRVDNVTCEPATVSYRVPIRPLAGARPVPVKAVLSGAPGAGREVGAVHCQPASVTVTGDAASLAALAAGVPTAPLEVNGQTRSFERRVSLALPPGVVARPDAVTVQVTIKTAHKRGP